MQKKLAGLLAVLSSAVVYAAVDDFDAEQPSVQGGPSLEAPQEDEMDDFQSELQLRAHEAAQDGDCALVVERIEERIDGTEMINGHAIPKRVFSVVVKDASCDESPSELVCYGVHQYLDAGTSIVFARLTETGQARIRYSAPVDTEATIASLQMPGFK